MRWQRIDGTARQLLPDGHLRRVACRRALFQFDSFWRSLTDQKRPNLIFDFAYGRGMGHRSDGLPLRLIDLPPVRWQITTGPGDGPVSRAASGSILVAL